MNSQREAFERSIKLYKGVYWCDSANCYMRDAGGGFTVSDRTANDKWEGWQAATEQGDTIPDPVGTESAYEYAKDRNGNMTISCSLVVDLVEALRSSRKPIGGYVPIERPINCRNALRDEGKGYPKSGCQVCGDGGLRGCPYEHRLATQQPKD